MPPAATARKPDPVRILQELESLPFAALNRLMPRIAALRVKKHPLVLSAREEWLQKRVEACVPRALWDGYRNLIFKRRKSGLTAREQKRLESLAGKIESFNVEWLQWAKELADLRRMTVDRLLGSLDIQRPADV